MDKKEKVFVISTIVEVIWIIILSILVIGRWESIFVVPILKGVFNLAAFSLMVISLMIWYVINQEYLLNIKL